MRILLIAYEFPPSRSPQALRWMYLSRHLAERGVDVHVLTPDLGLPSAEDVARSLGITIHRGPAGPFQKSLRALQRLKARRTGPVAGHDGSAPADSASPLPSAEVSLNWRGKLVASMEAAMGLVIFPDARGEWRRSGLSALSRLLSQIEPDVVVSSHEPAVSLQLGLAASARGYPWIADLGDPVLADYTPRRWRRMAGRLEGEVLERADHVLTTTEAARDLLVERHRARPDKISVLTQGFEPLLHEHAVPVDAAPSNAPLELLYTGSFYAFRSGDNLVRALVDTPGVRLTVASRSVPQSLRLAAQDHPDKLKLLGFVEHRSTRRLQAGADVLVNLSNSNPVQVPGKFYEYLGAGRPILHIGDQEKDVAPSVLATLGAGWYCADDTSAISRRLSEIVRLKQTQGVAAFPSAAPNDILKFSWRAIAEQLHESLEQVAGRAPRPRRPVQP